jgi:hypothetical protein
MKPANAANLSFLQENVCISKIILNAEYAIIHHTIVSASLDTKQAVLAGNACTAICLSSMFLRSSK